MKNSIKKGKSLAIFPLSALSLAVSGALYAQSEDAQQPESSQENAETSQAPLNIANPIEEVMVLGRMKSAAGDIVLERMESEVAVDLISAELISRVGDSNVANALRRVPGVTLVEDKFVYVRGLGERYSSTTLNGAAVPSPDLTRNVVPLDIFPTSIVESLSVQKMASADASAAFGGGTVDIRTKSIPDSFLLAIGIGTGENSNAGKFYSYAGGGDDSMGTDDGERSLPGSIANAVSRYRGSFSNIEEIDGITSDEADAINRDLALSLKRDIHIWEEKGKMDQSYSIDVGNNFVFDNSMEFGFLTGLSYGANWRNSEKKYINSSTRIGGTNVFQDQSFQKQSTYNVSLTANLNMGLRLNDENYLKTTQLFLRNTDDKTSIEDTFNSDNSLLDNSSSRKYDIRYEEREMIVNQIHGEHELGYSTLETIGWDFLSKLEGLKLNWFYSDSESTSDIPSEITVSGGAGFSSFSPFTLRPQTSSVRSNSSAANFRYTDLEDHMKSHGWEVAFPIETSSMSMTLSAGSEYWEKLRAYRQLQLGLGSVEQGAPTVGTPGQIFRDSNISNPDYGFFVNVSQTNADSYIAAAKANAVYGKIDAAWNDKWRLATGLRWEDYQQVGLPWDILDFDGSQLIPDNVEENAYNPTSGNSNVISDYFRDATFSNDDTYLSAALTYMTQDFFAEDFQLRFGFSETTVRPDLREITESSYTDPLTDFLVFGDADLVPSDFKNYDVRAEWFFESGDNVTLTFFHKDIDNPIDVQEEPRSDDDRAVKFFNAESAEITGIEVEFLKSLAGLHHKLEPFFVQGNATFLDTSTKVGDQALDATNAERDLVGASDALNIIFGYDSGDGKHAATTSYTWFGERLYFAGRNGQPDVYEQPYGSLDFTYSYYPNDQFTVKFKTKNLLDETSSYKREGAGFTLLEEEKGTTYSLSVSYKY